MKLLNRITGPRPSKTNGAGARGTSNTGRGGIRLSTLRFNPAKHNSCSFLSWFFIALRPERMV